MYEFIVSGLIGCVLIAWCSLNIYEVLRFTWRFLPSLKTHPRWRVLWMIPIVFAGHIVNIWIFGFVYYVMYRTGFGSLTNAEISSGQTVIDIYECIYFPPPAIQRWGWAMSCRWAVSV